MASKSMIDNYTHPSADVFYCDTNIPGAGGGDWHALSVQCGCAVCGQGCPCVRRSGGLNYANGLLLDAKTSGAFVLECGEQCACGSDCGNRVVQRGPREGLAVVPAGARGLGLRTERRVPRGGFVCEYAGEVIGKHEARRRATYDAVNYIFVLREHSVHCTSETIVDPTRIGNIGRYINHSCYPNAVIVPVRVDTSVPRLGVFALKDIPVGGEVTYDYSSGAPQSGTEPCLCGEDTCRKFLPFDNDVFN